MSTERGQPVVSVVRSGWLRAMFSRRFAYFAGVVIPLSWLVAHWRAPLVEDALFWFVPTAIQQAESGPVFAAQGALPAAVAPPGAAIPPQWGSGLPDYAHPPIWYWWLGAFLRQAATLDMVRMACVLPAIAVGVGFVALGDTHRRPLAGLMVWTIPGVLAQILRPELDLPLLACVPWALVALKRRCWHTFGLVAALATWLKEPGVLLFVPGFVEAVRRREARWQVLMPLAALAAWAGIHNGLAPVLQRPTSWGQIGDNLLGVGRFLTFDQGRVVLLVGAAALLAAPVELSLVLAFSLFFAYVRYYATSGNQDAYTHIRYLLPAVAVYVVAASARLRPPLALAQLFWLHRIHVNGPEGSMAGVDAAYADRAALESLPVDAEPWVGTYLAAGVGRTWTGYPDKPIRVYSFETTPGELSYGDLLVVSAYGEPATRLERALRVESVSTWHVGEVETRIVRVIGHNPKGWVPAVAPPR